MQTHHPRHPRYHVTYASMKGEMISDINLSSTFAKSEYFLNSLTKITDYFANSYDKHLILGDFNLKPTDSTPTGFLDNNSLTNLIKTNTCFKGKGVCIDLILTNRNFSFKFTPTYETGITDHRHMIYTKLYTILFSKYRAKTFKL